TQPAYYNITIPFFQSSVTDPTTRALFVDSASFFDLYNFCPNTCPNNYWNAPAALQKFVVDTFSEAANATPTQTFIIGQIYSLGASAGLGDFTTLAGTLLRNYNINSYPVLPSKDVYTQFVSGSNDT